MKWKNTDRQCEYLTQMVMRTDLSYLHLIDEAQLLSFESTFSRHFHARWGKRKKKENKVSHRVTEVALSVSFNDQSQAPDIPGASSRALLLRHTASLQAQSKAPDILSLRAYTEELLVSLNAQAQAPDNPSKTLVSDSHLLSLRAYMEELSASLNAQDQAPDDLHAQDRQCAPCIFVENSHHYRPELLRLPTKQDASHFYLQLVSQDSAQEFFNRLMTLPYQGVSRIEFHVSCLWIPVVRQGVDCFYSVDLGCSWTFTVISFNDQRGAPLLAPSLVFTPRRFASRHIWGVFHISFVGFYKLNVVLA